MSEKSFQLSSPPPSPDLAALAAILTETAQALQNFSQQNRPPQKEHTTSLSSGETRCYHLSAAPLKQERELLQRHRAEDFQGLLAETHLLLAGLVKVMKSTHPDARLRGSSVSSLGALLEQVSGLLMKMRNVYEQVERISA